MKEQAAIIDILEILGVEVATLTSKCHDVYVVFLLRFGDNWNINGNLAVDLMQKLSKALDPPTFEVREIGLCVFEN